MKVNGTPLFSGEGRRSAAGCLSVAGERGAADGGGDSGRGRL